MLHNIDIYFTSFVIAAMSRPIEVNGECTLAFPAWKAIVKDLWPLQFSNAALEGKKKKNSLNNNTMEVFCKEK